MRLFSASYQMIISSALLLLLCAFTSGDHLLQVAHPVLTQDATDSDLKEPVCCKTLTTNEPRIKINSCYFLQETSDCLKCVLFVDDMNRMYCIDLTAPWLSERIKRLEEDGVQCINKPNNAYIGTGHLWTSTRTWSSTCRNYRIKRFSSSHVILYCTILL